MAGRGSPGEYMLLLLKHSTNLQLTLHSTTPTHTPEEAVSIIDMQVKKPAITDHLLATQLNQNKIPPTSPNTFLNKLPYNLKKLPTTSPHK